MPIKHPFEYLSTAAQRRAFMALLVFTLVVAAGMQVLGGPLKTEAAPYGIVSFEFAGEQSQAQEMIESWGLRGQIFAGLGLGLDYLFIVAYASCIAMGCVLVARRLSKRGAALDSAGVYLAWAQFGAAVLDGVENYALIRVLLGSPRELWLEVAWWCAAPKFVLVVLGLVYIVVGGVVAAGAKREGVSA